MPTALRSGPYRLFFYSGDRHEPLHVHDRGPESAPSVSYMATSSDPMR